ncbi:MAG: cation:proton antiporter domain-containing protein [Armatimonadota bacterium]
MAVSTLNDIMSGIQSLELSGIRFTSIFNELVALLLLTACIGAVALRMRQPLIIGFIIAGILAGPSGLKWISSAEEIHLLAEIGLSLLLFVVGLRLDVGLMRSMGLVSLAIGIGQVIFTTIIGYLVAIVLGMPPVAAIYTAVALTFSSTILIVKLLSDKHEADSLHGRMAVGVLIVQDILVILVMIVITAFSSGTGDSDIGSQALLILVKGLSLLAGLGLAMYFILPRLLNTLAHSPELLVLFSIAWALGISSASEALGFSKEVGAFLAGVSIASTSYREIIGARLVSLRDFLLLFFFIDLGMRLNLGLLGRQVWNSIPLSLFVLIGNPLIVMILMGLLGYRKRTSFLSGLLLAQVSEFSLILVSLGSRLGHIGSDTVGLVTLVTLTTIGLSSYLILYSDDLYERFSPYLVIFERKIPHKEQSFDASGVMALQADTIMFGLGRYGYGIGQHLNTRGYKVLGIDFDPQAVESWNQRGGIAWFGDAEDPEFPSMLPLSSARWVVSSLPDPHVNVALVRALQSHNYVGSIAVTAHNESDAETLRLCGADVVFIPFADAALQAVDILIEVEEKEKRKKMDELIASLSNHYIVCGYGRMGQQIVKDFQHQDVKYVVIESNPIQIPKLKEQNIPYVDGIASEDRVLKAAGIERAKGLISVNQSDEENVFIVLTARGLNPKLYIVARSILQENEDKLKRAGANKVISPYVLGGHRMAEAVLSPRTLEFLDLVTQYDHNDTELGDIQISEKSPFAGKTVEDSRIRESTGVLVLAIKRQNGEKVTNPTAQDMILPGDEMIVMGTSEQVDTVERMASE